MIRIIQNACIAMLLLASASLFSQSTACKSLQIKEDTAYLAGKKFTGTCSEYYKSGNLRRETTFEDGLKHGKEIILYDNGVKRMEVNYFKGLRDGDCSYKFYAINGQLRSMLDYDKGKKIGHIIYDEIFYYPVIIGEKNGAVPRDLVKGKDSVKVVILRTYNKYFNDDGTFNVKEFDGTVFTPDMDYVTIDEVRFLSFRMKGTLPIYPPRKTIYDHVKFNAKSSDGYLTLSMRETFKNMLLKELTIEEVFLNRLLHKRNIVWQLPARKLMIAD